MLTSDGMLFLHSPLKEKIYGGTKIQKTFGFDEAVNQKIGEHWAISAHENGTDIISNGTYKNHLLKEVYKQHCELFHNAKEERLPLLIKINEITRSVSVQVHPDDVYAEKYENDLGKAEFCLYLDVDDGTKLIRDHVANTKEEFKELALAGKQGQLLYRTPAKAGDCVFTPAGIVHGVEGKILLAEARQSNDVIYRIHDYDNTEPDGIPRKLYLEKALGVICFPYKEPEINIRDELHGNDHILQYINSESLRITRCGIQESETISSETYSLCLILSREGYIHIKDESYFLEAGQGFVVTSSCTSSRFTGSMGILISKSGRV